MALHLVSRIGASPVWRAGLASIFILGLAAVAAAVIPGACRAGIFACGVQGDAPEIELAEISEAVEPSSPPAVTSAPEATVAAVSSEPHVATPLAAHQPASIAGNDLIAATFSALDSGLIMQPAELVSRKVRTVAVGADGQPAADTPSVAPLVPEETAEASAEPSVVAEPSEAPVAAEPSSVEQPSTQVAEAPSEPSSADVGATAYAPVKGGTALVTGKGANVRSKPQKGGSEVLFALAGGTEVTVVETSKGWSRVVDERGRSGWIWNDLLRR